VLSSQLLPSSELRALLFILDLWCLKVREQKRFHFLREDGDLADPSQLECSSWTSSVVASWIVFRLKHSGHQCWGGGAVSKHPDKIPEHVWERKQ
jgi:hypothetical protein